MSTIPDPVARRAVADLLPAFERVCRALGLPESTWPLIEPVRGLKDRTDGHHCHGEYQPARPPGTISDGRARLRLDRDGLLDGYGLGDAIHELAHHVCSQRRAGDDPSHGSAFRSAAERVAEACRKIGLKVEPVPWRSPDVAVWPYRLAAVKPKAPRTRPAAVKGTVSMARGERVDRRQSRPKRALVAAGGGESDEALLRRLGDDGTWSPGLRRQVLADRRRNGAGTRS
jgi:hypothetical protein